MKLTKAQESLRKSKEDAKKDKSRERSRSRERANRRANRERPLDREVALYAARADRGAKKGEARRKNYFQALEQYQTTVVGGATTVGGATAINERVDEDFTIKTTQEMVRFLRDEKLIETKYEFGGKWDIFFQRFKRNPMKAAIDEYCRMEEVVGKNMMNVLSKTTNLDGSKELKYKDIPVGKPPPLKRADDPAYELQWM
ncbi:hypothetical protein RB195_015774 [Necator americanus]|uniref:Uncharacterized protein n=1 Tax=Necator americanus TaxID=51031 RepID=A0ABR1E6K1_NECAM